MDQDKYKKKYLKYKKKYVEYQRGGELTMQKVLTLAAMLGATTIPVSAVINTATGLRNKENMDTKFALKILKQIFKNIGITVSSVGLLGAVCKSLEK